HHSLVSCRSSGRAVAIAHTSLPLHDALPIYGQLYEGYSAPEQYSAVEFEGRYTDVYSLSAVLYRMVCGQSPVPAAQRMVTDSNRSEEHTSELQSRFDLVCRLLLAKQKKADLH